MRSNFPREFQKTLIDSQSDYAQLTRLMAQRGYRITKQFIGMMAAGQRSVPPKQLKRICEVLSLDEFSRRALHRAAALDYGYDV